MIYWIKCLTEIDEYHSHTLTMVQGDLPIIYSFEQNILGAVRGMGGKQIDLN